ncbi:MAG: preprotein translocase subunit YajC [Wenzhouxiangellaceae bacterium]
MLQTISDFFISPALAQAAQPQQPSLIASMLPLLLIVVIFWLLIIRPQMKRTRQHREMVQALRVGDEIVTAGGLLGKITEVGESFVRVELADGVTVAVQKQSVAQLVPKGTLKSL